MSKEGRSVRIDKWLWATRQFKTRSLATEACRAGKVKVNGASAKPSKSVGVGEVITFRKSGIGKKIEVLGLVEKRVGAKLVCEYLEDLTPKDELEAEKNRRREINWAKRPTGMGRPTKSQRRALEEFFDRQD